MNTRADEIASTAGDMSAVELVFCALVCFGHACEALQSIAALDALSDAAARSLQALPADDRLVVKRMLRQYQIESIAV